MDRKLSDEQIDRIAKNLLQDFAPDAAALDEIADAPQLWWNVRKKIEAEKIRRERKTFAWLRPRVLAFGALAVLLGGALAFAILNFANNSDSIVALEKRVENEPPQIAQSVEKAPAVLPADDDKSPAKLPQPAAAQKTALKTPAPRNNPAFVAQKRQTENSARGVKRAPKTEIARAETAQTAETKTDFIALSYAANAESGQIVRVKVPSSMMVSLGVQSEVENASELVSAEVVIGDDGMARAIRFIR